MDQLIEEAMTKVANCGIAPGFGKIESEWISLAQLAGVDRQVNGMLICSAAMGKVMVAIARIAPYKTTVLIHGETGTGKDSDLSRHPSAGTFSERTVRNIQLLEFGRHLG